MRELVALVKHDCPVCDDLLPALDAAAHAGAPLRILSQSDAAATAAQAQRLHLAAVPALDDALALSALLDPDAVPALFLLDGDGAEIGRVEGLQRERIRELAASAGVVLALEGLPEHRPGCASRTRDPDVAATLAVRAARAAGRLGARPFRVGALEDVQEALHERGLTDGLPVVPPTPERVVAMLAHTSRHPQDIVGVVPPYDGVATVEKVAINAVMAGCPGEVLPLVLAAVEAACDEAFALQGVVATTYPAGPTVVVSGPLADAVGMASGGNCLGQGNRANLTIGRALQLVVRNVGGGRPGREDRAAHGWMGKLSSCFAERTADSPWEPLSVERGLAPGETGVTVFATEAPRVLVDQAARDPESLAASLAQALEGIAHPYLRSGFDALLVLGPEHARPFAEAGWSKDRLRAELLRCTTRPAGELLRHGTGEGLATAPDPALPVPKFARPGQIAIVHAGGDAGLFSMVYGSWAAGALGSDPVTRSVEPWR
jgi:hypothetical protein